jgi:hypothetical protein
MRSTVGRINRRGRARTRGCGWWGRVWIPGAGRSEWYPSRTARSGRGQELADVVEPEDEDALLGEALLGEALLEDDDDDDDEELDELGAGSTLLLADRESVR